jgi:uncharacterized protein (TIGR00730 family)
MAAICVYCSSSDAIDGRYLALAEEVGGGIAARGHTLVSGGGSVSMMGAVARAARAGGARTVGVIPRALLDLEVADHDADELVVTADMRERKGEMESRADAFLALPGGLGTFEELFEIWVGLTLGLHGKPVVVLDPDGILSHLRAQVDASVDAGFVRAAGRDVVTWATSVDEALDAIDRRWAAGPPLRSAPAVAEMLEAEP